MILEILWENIGNTALWGNSGYCWEKLTIDFKGHHEKSVMTDWPPVLFHCAAYRLLCCMFLQCSQVISWLLLCHYEIIKKQEQTNAGVKPSMMVSQSLNFAWHCIVNLKLCVCCYGKKVIQRCVILTLVSVNYTLWFLYKVCFWNCKF